MEVQYELREYAAAKQSYEQALLFSYPETHMSACPPIPPSSPPPPSHLAIRRNPCLPTTPISPESLNNLGIVQSALRDYAAAKQSHEQAWRSAASPCLQTTPLSPTV